MAKRKLYATSLTAREISFDCPIAKNDENPYSFKIKNTVVKRDIDEDHMERIKSPKLSDLNDQDVHIFCFIEIDGVKDTWLKDMQILNGYKFQDVIEVASDGTFTLKDGAVVQRVGESLVFHV